MPECSFIHSDFIQSGLHLQLMAISGNAARFYARQQHPKYESIKTELLNTQGGCAFCGYNDQKSLQIINKNFDYADNHRDNLSLACVFCAHTQLLDDSLWVFESQQIIYLPEVSQITLNQTYHRWQAMLKQKTGTLEITQMVSELLNYADKLKEILGVEPLFHDMLGLFAVPYQYKGFMQGLRWVPKIDLLKKV